MVYEIVNEFPNKILDMEEGPFISLYQPTHRHRPENKQDLIRFKNLIQEIEDSLKQKYPKQEIGSLMEPFYVLSEDRIFWNHTLDGLAVLSAGGRSIVYNLHRPVNELAVVADSFHIKPLIRVFQSADRYHVLGINRKNFTLYEGNRYGFEEIEIGADIPRTMEEVLGEEYSEPYLSQGFYGGAGGTPMFHGHGGRRDEINKDTERYFRYVDKFILENYSNPMGIPLILAALDEHHGLFRSITGNPYLNEKGIRKDYETLSSSQIREDAWEVIEPFYLEKTRELVDRYNLERSKFLASDDLAQVARAALENRIDTIMIEADRIIPGRINKETGELERGQLDNPELDDLLDDIAEMVFKNKGEVVVLPKERIPSETGIAAIYRF